MVTRGVEFSFDQAVKTLGVTPEKLDKLIEEGKIKAVHEGIYTRIPRQSILEYLHDVSAVPLKQRKG
jgi:excisionase family DNA binding protein